MERIQFDEPVVVWLVPERHELGVRRIRDVQEGRAALFRYGIEKLRKGAGGEARRLWADASHALFTATRNPRPDCVSRARRALLSAARKAGALTAPDPLGDLVARGFDFAP
jgi:hypothetical protein